MMCGVRATSTSGSSDGTVTANGYRVTDERRVPAVNIARRSSATNYDRIVVSWRNYQRSFLCFFTAATAGAAITAGS
jgi:hypothetical protein